MAKRKKNLKLVDIIPNFIEEAVSYFSHGLSLKQIAEAFGITRDELVQYMQDDIDFMVAMNKQRNINVLNVAENLLEKAKDKNPRNNNAMFYFLDKVGRFSDNWSEEKGTEPPLSSVELKITTTDPTEAMRQYEKIMTDYDKKEERNS